MKRLEWIGTSKKDLKEFPEAIKGAMGYALHLAQCGERHGHAKTFSGIGNAKVLEIRENDRRGTYRTIYTLEMDGFMFCMRSKKMTNIFLMFSGLKRLKSLTT